MRSRDLSSVANSIRFARDARKKGCALLIGAGCSVKAGIPTATDFSDIISKEFEPAYRRATPKTYAYLMAELTYTERHSLIKRYIDKAKLNWAYLAIAQLLKKGYVDRVLTVNFDPLLMRACALVGVFPAVYDFAASQNFIEDLVAPQSVFYLHGQHTGFVLLNTPAEVQKFSDGLRPLLMNSVQGHVCIVAGYSGDHDPVFSQLAEIPQYHNGLYWICYKDNLPPPHVQEKLLVDTKDSFYVQGYDADDFFVGLAQELKCFPPDIFQKPFTHLESLLQDVLPYSLPGRDSGLEAIPKKFLRDAIEKIENAAERALHVNNLLLAGEFDDVIAMRTELDEKLPEEAELIAWGYVSAGNRAASEALKKSGEEADQLWTLAAEKYEAAVALDPKKHAAFYNWGIALSLQAKTKTGNEADHLWSLGREKYAAALEIKPDKYEALFNWAASLADQARTKRGEEADRLWTSASEKFEATLSIMRGIPDLLYDNVLYDWGTTLMMQASTKTGAEADRLWIDAGRKFEEAVKIKPDYHEALRGWGAALNAQARTKSGKEADDLFALAREKYAAALKIKPDKYEALFNWAASLAYEAGTKRGEEADRLWEQASEKYEATLRIKPDNYNAFYDWGVALMIQARTKSGAEADQLWVEAGRKFEAALKIKPKKHEALYNWGFALNAQAKTKSGKEADDLWTLAREKYKASLKIKPDKHQSYYGLSLTFRSQAMTKTGTEAEQLNKSADEYLMEARKIAPELYPGK